MSDKVQRVHVVLTTRQYAKMKELSSKTGYKLSELMRRAVDAFLHSANKDG